MKKFIIISAVIGLILICLYGSTFGWQKLNPSVNYSQPLDSSLASRLQGHVFVLSETIGDRNMRREAALKKSGDYIMRQFKNSGLTAKRQDYSFEGQTAYNLIAEKIGTTHPKEIVLIGAHYDSRLNPGADDDASGIAVLLELAELLSPRTLSRTVKFVAFTNEEDSLFKGKDDKTGSSVYAKEARQTGELIRASIILDMVGYFTDQPFSQRYLPILGWFFPNRGNFILVAGNTLSKKLVRRIVESWNHFTRFPMESMVSFEWILSVNDSDHVFFWKEGFPAVMITDTCIFRNPHYHRSSDAWQTLNYRKMAIVVEGIASAIADLANKD